MHNVFQSHTRQHFDRPNETSHRINGLLVHSKLNGVPQDMHVLSCGLSLLGFDGVKSTWTVDMVSGSGFRLNELSAAEMKYEDNVNR